MQQLEFHEIKTAYYYGGKTKLTPSWNSYNVICPTSKLYFVIDGEIIVKVANVEYLLKRGDCALIPQGVKHSFYLSNKNYAVKYWFHFDLFQGENYFTNLKFNYVCKIDEYEKVLALFESIGKNVNSLTASSKLIISSAVLSIVATFLNKANAQIQITKTDEIDEIIKLIQSSPSSDFNLEQLALAAHLSPNYFLRKFKEKTGFSPIKYVTFIKMEKAKALLEETEKPINEIMIDLGLCDGAYFSKTFKQHTGYSPRKYREIYGNNSTKYNY